MSTINLIKDGVAIHTKSNEFYFIVDLEFTILFLPF
jgi:hypothetical protein